MKSNRAIRSWSITRSSFCVYFNYGRKKNCDLRLGSNFIWQYYGFKQPTMPNSVVLPTNVYMVYTIILDTVPWTSAATHLHVGIRIVWPRYWMHWAEDTRFLGYPSFSQLISRKVLLAKLSIKILDFHIIYVCSAQIKAWVKCKHGTTLQNNRFDLLSLYISKLIFITDTELTKSSAMCQVKDS